MIERIENRCERSLDVGEVHDPAKLRVDRSGYMNLYAERMAVKARALVVGRNGGQAMRSLDLENLEQIHGALLPEIAVGGQFLKE
jgi:hypothetical protein